MADRIASYDALQQFMKGGSAIADNSEDSQALNQILDGVSSRIAKFILRSTVYRLAQLASDGVNSPLELYGTEHYGHTDRNVIRLNRHCNFVAITSIIDNVQVGGGNPVTSDAYNVDTVAAVIYRRSGMFYPYPKCTQVIYTSGYPATGAADTACLQVPEDLRNACMLQCQFEFNERQPGGVPAGATTIARPDGSLVIPAQEWLPRVLDVLLDYRK